MLNKLLQKFNLLGNNIKKRDVVVLNDAMYTAISNDILGVIQEAAKIVKEGKSIDKDYLTLINRRFPKVKRDLDAIMLIERLMMSILSNRKALDDLIDELPDVINTKANTLRTANTLNVLGDVSSFVIFGIDFINILLENPIRTYNDKAKAKDMIKRVPGYLDLCTYIDNLEESIVTAKKLDSVIVVKTDNPTIAATLLNNNSAMPNIISGFGLDIYKGIYVIRAWWVDRDIEKYELLSKKKEMFELKVIAFRQELKNESIDSNLKKRIELYVEEIESIEYKMIKIKNK